ncbi:PH domain-containing protein [Planctomycetota bacterium]
MMVLIDLKTKACPFCAEIIQSAAVKCRFCGEFLNTAKARALAEPELVPDQEAVPEDQEQDQDGVLFAGRPSFLSMVATMIKAGVMLAIVSVIIKFPLEVMVNNLIGSKLTTEQVVMVGEYRIIVGWGLMTVIILGLLLKAFYLKMIYYEVSADRIEWSRGILDRRIDNIDMFRVVDLKLRRSLFDCIFGIGTVALITNDKTDPQFKFKKVRKSRQLYDIIKKASLDADRRAGVVHLE